MSNCPVCKSSDSQLLFESKNIPTYCNILWESVSDARNCPKGDIKLEYCRNCGHVYNSAFDPKMMDYTESYENSLHFSPRFQRFAEDLATSLIDKHHIRGKNIVEIGCGKGDFLKIISEKGNNKGYGFDKSYDPSLETSGDNVNSVSFIQDWYSKKYRDTPVDYLLCRHVLEHIEQPAEFLSEIKAILDSKEVGIYFEVPNILYTLRDLGIWDLIYEHCGYFTPNSIAYLFENEGFNVSHVEEKYAHQFLGIEASTLANGDAFQPGQPLEEITRLAHDFSKAYSEKVAKWNKKLDEMATQGKTMVVWGGGSKGVTFVNILDSKAISAIVDINPRKQGKYAAGTGHKYVSPEDLKAIQPDLVIAMNPIYKDEISSTVKSLGLDADVIVENEL